MLEKYIAPVVNPCLDEKDVLIVVKRSAAGPQSAPTVGRIWPIQTQRAPATEAWRDSYDTDWDDELRPTSRSGWLKLLIPVLLLAAVIVGVLMVVRPPPPPPPTVTPTFVLALQPSSTPALLPSSTPTNTPVPPTPTPESQVLYAVEQTTEYTFATDGSGTKAAELLASLDVPPDEIAYCEAPPSWLAGINDLAGAVYDPPTGQLLLLGTHDPDRPEINPADLLVALRSAYAYQDDVGVSIDPINPNDLGGDMQVSYYGNTAGTHFGLVMFEADRYLKILSAGQDNLTGRPVTSTVPGYRSELDWMLEFGDGTQEPQWHRMWYLIENGELGIRVSADGNAMMFDDVSVMVEARFVVFDEQGKSMTFPVPTRPWTPL